MPQLLSALTYGPVSNDVGVAKQLAQLASEYPLEVIHAFSSLVGGNPSNWAVDARKDSLHDSLATVFASDDREAISVATEFVHRLGRLGYFEFRPLLDSIGD